MNKNYKVVEDHFQQNVEDYSSNYSSDRKAKTYNFNKRLELVTSLCQSSNGTLLECATGSGELTCSVLLDSGIQKATIIDISSGMLAISKKRIQSNIKKDIDIEFIVSDVFEYLKSQDLYKYDTILVLGLIAHTGKLNQLLDLLNSKLREKGKIIIQSSLSNHPVNKLVRFLSGKSFENKSHYALNYYSKKQLKNSFSSSGFVVKKSVRYGLGLDFLDKYIGSLAYYLEVIFSFVSKKLGSDIIFVLERKNIL